MLCENCKEREATVHFTEIMNGRVQKHHLCNSLYKYLDIYHNGLKKLANKEMQAIVGHLREMSDENQDEILTQFLSDYCDSDVWDTLKDRGNADIPYELKEYIVMWITPRC